MNKERALSFIGLMKKAGAVVTGELNTGDAARERKAVLIGVCEDSSDNAKHRAANFSDSNSIPLVLLPFRKSEISAALGISDCSMLAFKDSGFAAALLRNLGEQEYSELIFKLDTQAKRSATVNRKKHRRTNI